MVRAVTITGSGDGGVHERVVKHDEEATGRGVGHSTPLEDFAIEWQLDPVHIQPVSSWREN